MHKPGLRHHLQRSKKNKILQYTKVNITIFFASLHLKRRMHNSFQVVCVFFHRVSQMFESVWQLLLVLFITPAVEAISPKVTVPKVP